LQIKKENKNPNNPIRKRRIRMKVSVLDAHREEKQTDTKKRRNGYLPETSLKAILLCNFLNRRKGRQSFSFLCFFFESLDSKALQARFGGWN
jgi:hypothetical protein